MGDVELRHGFTFGHAEALAWQAVRHHIPTSGLDLGDRFEAAWGAAVEYLYGAVDPPSSRELVCAGLEGLARLSKDDLHERGFGTGPGHHGRERAQGAMSARSFHKYWTAPAPLTPEQLVVERAAVWQILPELSGLHAQALLALAVHGDYARAAAALGLPVKVFNNRVGRARVAFFKLWHEGETPSRMWRKDKRVERRVPLRQAASHADAVRVLSELRDAFGGQPSLPTVDLLARLAAACPERYGDWGPKDLADFVRPYGVRRDFVRSYQVQVGGQHRMGYRLAHILSALDELTGAQADGPAAERGAAA